MASKAKIGFFSGSFDPVHLGHLEFALESIKEHKLSVIYFLPERIPRNKHATHYAHRLAMIKLAIKPYPKLKVLDLPEKQFEVNKTLPKINKISDGNKPYLLIGSDLVSKIKNWPNSKVLLSSAYFIVAQRKDKDAKEVESQTKKWANPPLIMTLSADKSISSRVIRSNLMKNKPAKGLLPSTKKYIRDNWLYISLDSSS